MQRSARFLWIVLLAWPSAVWAANGASAVSGLGFLLPRDARPVGMGGAYVAVASGADSLLWNPAGLNQLRDWQLGLGQLNYVQGTTDDYLQLARPIYGLGAWGLGATYFDSGTQQYYDVSGNNMGSFSDWDFSAQLALAVQLPDDLSLGLTYKILRESYAYQNAMGSAFDLGLQWRHILPALDMGFTAQNLGTPMALGSTYSPLPETLKLGLALHLGPNVLLAADEDFEPWTAPNSNHFWGESINLVHVGAEANLPVGSWTVTGRAGYIWGPSQMALGGITGLSVGGGVTLGDWQVDYAWVPMGDLGQTHRLSLTYSVGD
ncbi:MAG TPA: PorV/PorQ family protein [bacterium]|jgi:hypothetical protein|nr:PorV/PorQ family protein [bacterium]